MVLALVGLLAISAGGAAGAPRPIIAFERSTIAAGAQPFAIAAADLNADGRMDLVVTHPATDSVSIHLGDGRGRFASPRVLRTRRFPRGVAVADFDRDGRADLAVAATFAAAVAIHFGDGHGSFAPAIGVVEVGSHPFLISVGDINGDGLPDLATALEGGGRVAVLLNDGKRGFSSTTLAAGRSPTATAIADVDHDHFPDLAIASWKSNEIAVLHGDGTGAFAPLASFSQNGWGLYSMLLEDVDRDGALDLVWTDVKRAAVVIRYGDGRGTFPRSTSVPTGAGVRSTAVVDLDGDGHPDIVASNLADDTITVALADHAGGFTHPQTVAVGQHPRMVVAVDLDGNEQPDLVTSNMASGDLTVLLNRGLALPTPTSTAPRTPSPGSVALFDGPTNIALDPHGRLVVADRQQHRVARVDPATGRVVNLAGTGEAGFTSDGGSAATARFNQPSGVAVDGEGNVYVADLGNHVVRWIDTTGTVMTLAGTGVSGYSGDGGPARDAQLSSPFAIAVDARGDLYVGDSGNARVRRVERSSGIITTVLGTGIPGTAGDGGPGTTAQVGAVSGLAIDRDGHLLVTDQVNRCIRRLSRSGIVTTLIGGGEESPRRRGQAPDATVRDPANAVADGRGGIFISDQDGNRIRRLAPDGTLSTVAGTGVGGYDGDGGPAAAARIWFPFGMVVAPDGTLYFADRYNAVIRRVDPRGIIGTVTGVPREQARADRVTRAPQPLHAPNAHPPTPSH